MEHLSADAVSIWHHMQHHEKELWHKRKSILPESFLRKDDVFYEDVKSYIEKGFRQACDTEARQSKADKQQKFCELSYVEKGFRQACDTEARQSKADEQKEFCEFHNWSRIILALLDDLSNNGLCCLVKIVTRGSGFSEKTRPQMMRVIKNSLQEIHSTRLDSNHQGIIQNQLSQLLRDPKNFHQNHGKHVQLTREYLISAFEKIQLHRIPVRILCAMQRRLKGTQGVMPKLCSRPPGWSKRKLIVHLEKMWRMMIDQLDESDKLPEPLAKAMAVPGLYSKIASDYQDLSMPTFVFLPPEIEALQIEIVKAIWSLDHRFKKEELKNLQLLLDPKSEVSVTSLRKAIRNMLIDCLFECSDMEAVPDSLLDALSLINKKSSNTFRFSTKEFIEEEVECVLNVGAHMKQLLWSCVPDDRLDQEFADAYMEELEENDDGDIFDDYDQKLPICSMDVVQFGFDDFSEEVASTGEVDHASFSSATSAYKENCGNSDELPSGSSFRAFSHKDDCRDSTINGNEMLYTVVGDGSIPLISSVLQSNSDIMSRQDPPNNASVDYVNLAEKCLKQNSLSVYQRNSYVAIQEVCDQGSLVSYQIIGHILAEFEQREALGLNRHYVSYLRGEDSWSETSQEPVACSKDKDVKGSIIVQAVQQVIPSFSNSQLELLQRFMSPR
ncbi:uncharacterized protein LOC104902539 isoform X2 [Beta vulgaris subsp. vulgaris]|uniref:uncharacterized protein LOC104902539 isoform X2 n=1 Tax=Beta vulgaris subsp. vulgaris TaxID=3555 RepID=UPI00254668AA|nr:uncharacterized protein LOC104902539 isoform X2 [Beta vulgaris subsp. vulgaris]